MKVVAISDLHGQLPEIPECDLLIIAGDICPVEDHRLFYQDIWLRRVFNPWLQAQPANWIVGVWGNHDWIGEKVPNPDIDCTFLTDAGTIIYHGDKSYRIYGLPWQKRFCDWAFNLDEPELNLKYEAIPECEIIISHGPAYGYGDKAPRSGGGFELTGSMAFVKRIDEIKPKLVVTGHIHCDPGVWKRGETIICNATLLDNRYRVANEPRVFDV
jgi:hypothetical protein